LEIIQLIDNKAFLMETYLCRQNGIMECRNAGILGIRTEINHFIVKNSFKPIIPFLHHSIIPIGAKPLSYKKIFDKNHKIYNLIKRRKKCEKSY
jgi:hypothetical protein